MGYISEPTRTMVDSKALSKTHKTHQKQVFVAEMIGVTLFISRLGIPFLSMFISPLVLFFAGWKGLIKFTAYSFFTYILLNPVQIFMVFTFSGASIDEVIRNIQQVRTSALGGGATATASTNQMFQMIITLGYGDLAAAIAFILLFASTYFFIRFRLAKQFNWVLSGRNR